MKKIPMLERFAAQSLVESEGELIFSKEKFAELIVKECIAQCEKNAEHEWLGSGSKLSAFNIKQHFGVGL